jgi:tetratricopeptide (TPR) repeat protein
MREPLLPIDAYTVDIGDENRWQGHPTQPHGWFSVTHIAYRMVMLPPERRAWFLETLPLDVLPQGPRRPTHIDHEAPAPTHPMAIAAEQLRVIAEDMERDGCFEMAFTTVSSAARLVSLHDAGAALSATNHLARITRQLGETAAAEEIYTSVVEEAKRLGLRSVAGYAMTGLGNLAIMRGNRPAQKFYYEEALDLAPAGSALEGTARWGLMNHALAVHSLPDALLHGWRAYDLLEGDEMRAGILSNLASVAHRGGFLEAAVGGYLGALQLAEPPRLWLSIAASAGEALGDARRIDRLTMLEAEGRPRASAAGPFEVAQWLLGLARGWQAAGAMDAASRFATESRHLAQQHEFHEVVYRADALLNETAAAPATRQETAGSAEADLPFSVRGGLLRLVELGA